MLRNNQKLFFVRRFYANENQMSGAFEIDKQIEETHTYTLYIVLCNKIIIVGEIKGI